MNKMQEQVTEFHRAFEIHEEATPTFPNDETARLRLELISEELEELRQGLAVKDLVEVADALGYILYVVFGSAVSFGIDMEPIVDEIHRSNMSKVGGHKREDGKWVKPETYSPANLLPILEAQR